MDERNDETGRPRLPANAPHGIALDATGAIYVAESFGKAVLKFVKQ